MIWMRDNFSLILGCLLQFALTENENTAHLITDTPPLPRPPISKCNQTFLRLQGLRNK